MRRYWSPMILAGLSFMPACGPAPAIDEQVDAGSLHPAPSPMTSDESARMPMQPKPSAAVAKTARRTRTPTQVPDLPPPDDDDGPIEIFPAEVTAFMVDRDRCDHFSSEEPYDAERRAFLSASIAQLCLGSDARLAALRARHATEPTVIAALDNYNDQSEEGEARRDLFDRMSRGAQ